MANKGHHLFVFFTSPNRRGSQSWPMPTHQPHWFNKSPQCLNSWGGSTTGCLPLKFPTACRKTQGNNSFIMLCIYIFVKNMDFCLRPPSFTFSKAVLSCIVAPKSRCNFFCRQTFFIFLLSYPFILSLSSTCQPSSHPWKRSSKATLFVPQPQTKPNGQKEDKKANEASKNITHIPYLQQPTEDVKNLFKYTTPATLLSLLLRKGNVLTSPFFSLLPIYQ